MNRVSLVGRLTAKPELRYTNGSNLPFARFSVAINRTFSNAQGQREADFINCIIWPKQAENVCNYLDKGSLVSVDGRLQTNNFTDKDGNKRYTMEVAADSVQFLESKSQSQGRQVNMPQNDVSPYDYQNAYPDNNVNLSDDIYADFGDSVSIDDSVLD